MKKIHPFLNAAAAAAAAQPAELWVAPRAAMHAGMHATQQTAKHSAAHPSKHSLIEHLAPTFRCSCVSLELASAARPGSDAAATIGHSCALLRGFSPPVNVLQALLSLRMLAGFAAQAPSVLPTTVEWPGSPDRAAQPALACTLGISIAWRALLALLRAAAPRQYSPVPGWGAFPSRNQWVFAAPIFRWNSGLHKAVRSPGLRLEPAVRSRKSHSRCWDLR